MSRLQEQLGQFQPGQQSSDPTRLADDMSLMADRLNQLGQTDMADSLSETAALMRNGDPQSGAAAQELSKRMQSEYGAARQESAGRRTAAPGDVRGQVRNVLQNQVDAEDLGFLQQAMRDCGMSSADVGRAQELISSLGEARDPRQAADSFRQLGALTGEVLERNPSVGSEVLKDLRSTFTQTAERLGSQTSSPDVAQSAAERTRSLDPRRVEPSPETSAGQRTPPAPEGREGQSPRADAPAANQVNDFLDHKLGAEDVRGIQNLLHESGNQQAVEAFERLQSGQFQDAAGAARDMGTVAASLKQWGEKGQYAQDFARGSAEKFSDAARQLAPPQEGQGRSQDQGRQGQTDGPASRDQQGPSSEGSRDQGRQQPGAPSPTDRVNDFLQNTVGSEDVRGIQNLLEQSGNRQAIEAFERLQSGQFQDAAQAARDMGTVAASLQQWGENGQYARDFARGSAEKFTDAARQLAPPQEGQGASQDPNRQGQAGQANPPAAPSLTPEAGQAVGDFRKGLDDYLKGGMDTMQREQVAERGQQLAEQIQKAYPELADQLRSASDLLRENTPDMAREVAGKLADLPVQQGPVQPAQPQGPQPPGSNGPGEQGGQPQPGPQSPAERVNEFFDRTLGAEDVRGIQNLLEQGGNQQAIEAFQRLQSGESTNATQAAREMSAVAGALNQWGENGQYAQDFARGSAEKFTDAARQLAPPQEGQGASQDQGRQGQPGQLEQPAARSLTPEAGQAVQDFRGALDTYVNNGMDTMQREQVADQANRLADQLQRSYPELAEELRSASNLVRENTPFLAQEVAGKLGDLPVQQGPVQPAQPPGAQPQPGQQPAQPPAPQPAQPAAQQPTQPTAQPAATQPTAQPTAPEQQAPPPGPQSTTDRVNDFLNNTLGAEDVRGIQNLLSENQQAAEAFERLQSGQFQDGTQAARDMNTVAQALQQWGENGQYAQDFARQSADKFTEAAQQLSPPQPAQGPPQGGQPPQPAPQPAAQPAQGPQEAAQPAQGPPQTRGIEPAQPPTPPAGPSLTPEAGQAVQDFRTALDDYVRNGMDTYQREQVADQANQLADQLQRTHPELADELRGASGLLRDNTPFMAQDVAGKLGELPVQPGPVQPAQQATPTAAPAAAPTAAPEATPAAPAAPAPDPTGGVGQQDIRSALSQPVAANLQRDMQRALRDPDLTPEQRQVLQNAMNNGTDVFSGNTETPQATAQGLRDVAEAARQMAQGPNMTPERQQALENYANSLDNLANRVSPEQAPMPQEVPQPAAQPAAQPQPAAPPAAQPAAQAEPQATQPPAAQPQGTPPAAGQPAAEPPAAAPPQRLSPEAGQAVRDFQNNLNDYVNNGMDTMQREQVANEADRLANQIQNRFPDLAQDLRNGANLMRDNAPFLAQEAADRLSQLPVEPGPVQPTQQPPQQPPQPQNIQQQEQPPQPAAENRQPAPEAQTTPQNQPPAPAPQNQPPAPAPQNQPPAPAPQNQPPAPAPQNQNPAPAQPPQNTNPTPAQAQDRPPAPQNQNPPQPPQNQNPPQPRPQIQNPAPPPQNPVPAPVQPAPAPAPAVAAPNQGARPGQRVEAPAQTQTGGQNNDRNFNDRRQRSDASAAAERAARDARPIAPAPEPAVQRTPQQPMVNPEAAASRRQPQQQPRETARARQAYNQAKEFKGQGGETPRQPQTQRSEGSTFKKFTDAFRQAAGMDRFQSSRTQEPARKTQARNAPEARNRSAAQESQGERKTAHRADAERARARGTRTAERLLQGTRRNLKKADKKGSAEARAQQQGQKKELRRGNGLRKPRVSPQTQRQLARAAGKKAQAKPARRQRMPRQPQAQQGSRTRGASKAQARPVFRQAPGGRAKKARKPAQTRSLRKQAQQQQTRRASRAATSTVPQRKPGGKGVGRGQAPQQARGSGTRRANAQKDPRRRLLKKNAGQQQTRQATTTRRPLSKSAVALLRRAARTSGQTPKKAAPTRAGTRVQAQENRSAGLKPDNKPDKLTQKALAQADATNRTNQSTREALMRRLGLRDRSYFMVLSWLGKELDAAGRASRHAVNAIESLLKKKELEERGVSVQTNSEATLEFHNDAQDGHEPGDDQILHRLLALQAEKNSNIHRHACQVKELALGLCAALSITDVKFLTAVKHAALLKDIGEGEVFAEAPEDVKRDVAQYLVEQGLWTGEALHDLGMLQIPTEILDKPGSLSEAEREIVRLHPILGERLLQRYPGFRQLCPVVRYHHERWDGGGYPDGLKGEEIPLGARIVGLSDAFMAMVTDRPYRKALNYNQARAELERNAGTQFDPQLVPVFLELLGEMRDRGILVD